MKVGTISRIVPTLQSGAGGVTTREQVQDVATEYGKVDVSVRSLRERAALLISIAHLDTRVYLRAATRQRHLSLPSLVASASELR